jgi:hypothetical protein
MLGLRLETIMPIISKLSQNRSNLETIIPIISTATRETTAVDLYF